MTPLIIESSSETPEITLNKTTNVFVFKGKSLPENPIFFYKPVLSWLDDYISNPNAETCVDFKFEYFNTSSSKIILDIMKRLEIIKNSGNNVIINWVFKEDDEDMLEAGEIYSERIDVQFNLISEENSN